MANINTNYGFDKCGSFEEIAMLALRRALDINEDGLVRVNIHINRKKELSVYFYHKSIMESVHFIHGSGSLAELNNAFVKYEAVGKKEVCHA
ncbi:hypothetical protein FAZ19_16115 [Sphingobacterium alkalisoli]|uniref:Uncharacterized protein n=1 Tax=Sphingobacterium alkalisoli TaxID=1874115 RepID=A0A4U0GX89_9SPHI|nr:hypothetical protein [Sphingobacterium alkalisoli]TJY63791.1 hypothetical protein FAZ19_16115 [Sphingobacterium alkalisoli]